MLARLSGGPVTTPLLPAPGLETTRTTPEERERLKQERAAARETLKKVRKAEREARGDNGTVAPPPDYDPLRKTRAYLEARARYMATQEAKADWEAEKAALQETGDRVSHSWGSQPDPEPPALLDCGNGPVVRPATLGTLHAPEKMGKTWTVMAWAVLEAMKGRKVLYVDYENGPRRFARRLRMAAGCSEYASPESESAKRLACLTEHIGYMGDPEGRITDEELSGYDLVVIDAAIDLVDNHTDTSRNTDTMNSAQAVNGVYRRLARTAHSTGACIVLVDHSNEKGESSGSRRKRGAVDWQAKADKQGSFTVISWEFDRDAEDDELPVVYLVFDGYRLQSWAPRPDTPPSLEEFANANRLSDEQTARYRQIVMAVAREPGEARRHYRQYGHHRDFDALIALNILTLDGESHVGIHPVCPGEWRWWWESAQADQRENPEPGA